MRRALAGILGFLSTVFGMLVVLPRINDAMWRIQLVFNEFSGVGVLLGTLAILLRRSGFGFVLGLLGAGLSAVPFSRFRRAQRDMDGMMAEALGADYEQHIPAVARQRMTNARWWVPHLLTTRENDFPAEVRFDVPYLETPSRILNLDVYRPTIPPAHGNQYPAVIAIHGGSWRTGDKGNYFIPHYRYLASQGYYVFDVQYRLTERDNVGWPVPLEDIRSAIRWVKSRAAIYNLDPERIALLGRSAGGHLALQAAYRATGGCADTRVRSVIAIYAPTNLRLSGWEPSPAVQSLLGGRIYEMPERYGEASPIDHAEPGVPPTMLIHGYMDYLVSPIHAEMVLNRLRVAQVPCVVLRVPWARHGFDAFRPGLGAQLTQYYLDRFLAWSLTSA
ncbi:MAG: alpha/beta hydrolase [Anaerolineae bacterium]